MLKGKRGVSACSLSSCRIRAEALARAFNNRIWPCVWISQRSSTEGDDGMSNGIDDEEEFFDASPSPVEVEDESLFCQQHSSAATEAGRAKLYELLQQHATDDAIDVFYDVSEDAGLTDTANDTCLKDDERESDQVDKVCESSVCCRLLDDECNFSKSDINDGQENELVFPIVNQSSGDSVKIEVLECLESHISNGEQQITSDPFIHFSSKCENCDCAVNVEENSYEESSENSLNEDNNLQEGESANVGKEDQSLNEQSDSENPCINEDKITKENEEYPCINEDKIPKENEEYPCINEDKIPKENEENPCINEDKIVKDDEENTFINEDKIPKEDEEGILATEVEKNDYLPSATCDNAMAVADETENSLDSVQNSDNVPDSVNEKAISSNDEENPIAIKFMSEIDSPSSESDTSDPKVSSPTSRLQVFDESRPKISRSTSLKTGKTPPGTPSRKKIVRFADVLGLDLEDVRHIMTGDLPIIPSSAYTDLNLKGTDLPSCEPISETIEVIRKDSASWKAMPGATATNVLYPKFLIPGEQPDFLDRVRNQGICLETVVISEMNVQCTCRVMNYGYYKKVIARYTVNDWQSSHDIDASYVSDSSNNEVDNFAFSIFLSPQNKNVKFALKYAVNGKEYWDNNRNQNYCLSYHGNYQMQHLPSPLWQHQFW